jgi:hypothetical protein
MQMGSGTKILFLQRLKQTKHQSKEPQKNILAVLIEGPSRIGHYFRPAFHDRNGKSLVPKDGPIIRPDGQAHSWKIHYVPRAAGGQGQITVTFDGQEQVLTLNANQREAGAVFDRFGLFNFQTGGQYVPQPRLQARQALREIINLYFPAGRP